MFRKDKPANAAIESLLAASTRIQGDLLFGGGLHLDGAVTGSVKSQGEGVTRLVIGESGVVEGSCEAQFVELHGGTITAESSPGAGTEFRFLLPVDGPLPAPAAAPTPLP